MDYRESPKAAPLLVVSTNVTALDRETGKQVWSYFLARPTRRFTIHERWVIVLDSEGDLHCIDLMTGARAGLVQTGLSGANAFLFDGERFYVTNDDTVVALDWNGALLWQSRVPTNAGWGLGGLAIPGQIVHPDFSRSG